MQAFLMLSQILLSRRDEIAITPAVAESHVFVEYTSAGGQSHHIFLWT